MYKLHLILKYLRKRRIAWVSLAAVTLCTAMVLVVISVMGGWLRMFRTSFHGLSGDVVVQCDSLAGFPYYQEMIDAIEKLPEVAAAAPVIQTYGLVNIANRKTDGVTVIGYPLDKIGKVNEFTRSLWRQYNQWAEWADGAPIYPGDRKRLHDAEGLTGIRLADSLLTLSRDERDRLRKAKVQAVDNAAALKRKRAAETDAGKAKALDDELTRAPWAQKAIAEFLALGDGEPANAGDRLSVRELVKDAVDDPDERLRPNDAERKIAREQAEIRVARPSFEPFLPPERYKQAFQFSNPRAKPDVVEDVVNWSGMIAGNGVVDIRKDERGKMRHGDFLYTLPVSLTVVGVAANGKVDVSNKAERNYWITDTSRTKVWQYDSKTVYVPFDVLQRDLGMDAQKAEQNGQEITLPARTKDLHVRVKPAFASAGKDLIPIRDKIRAVVDGVLDAKRAELGVAAPNLVVRTWEESQAKWLGAIEKEKVLVTALFGLISVVAIFLIFCIFYMIVVEKTRDIGIIKSVGATSSGVAGIFLGYGAFIGVLGAAIGLGIGYVIVHNINAIHDWLGNALGVIVWDPEVYAFDTIPNTMDAKEVIIICSVAVISSVLGALVPALRAARLNPVEALRWE